MSSTHPVGMECLGLRTALPPGRGDRAPPRRPPSRLSQGFPRKATRPGLTPSEGRAPHARNDGTTPTPTLPPFGHRLIVKAPVATQCLAIRPALHLGRAERVPPRKSPSPSPLSLAFFSIPDFPRDPPGNGPNLPPGLKTSIRPVSPICVFLEASPSWNAQP